MHIPSRHPPFCLAIENQQDLNGSIAVMNNLRPDLCGAYCRERGFLFFGVGWSNECSCGGTYGGYGESNKVRGNRTREIHLSLEEGNRLPCRLISTVVLVPDLDRYRQYPPMCLSQSFWRRYICHEFAA